MSDAVNLVQLQEDQFIRICMISILSFQFHPGNHLDQTDPEVRFKAIMDAYVIARDAAHFLREV